MKTVVLTGPTGAIGVALISELMIKGYKVYAVCRPLSKRIANIPENDLVSIIYCNLSDLQDLPQMIFEKCDIFIHLGWEGTYGDCRNDIYLQNCNIKYTLDAVNAANALGCHTFLGAGSQAEYGCVTGKMSPSTNTDPNNGYGIAKLCAGQMSRIACRQLGLKHLWVRIFSVYGPFDGMQTMIMASINKMLRNEETSFTKGEQQWDYLFSADVATALLLIATNGKDGSVYCLGSGKTRPIYEYVNMIKHETGYKLSLNLGEIPYKENQVMYLCADITALKNDIGFEPRFEFEEGIKKTIEYFKTNCLQ